MPKRFSRKGQGAKSKKIRREENQLFCLPGREEIERAQQILQYGECRRQIYENESLFRTISWSILELSAELPELVYDGGSDHVQNRLFLRNDRKIYGRSESIRPETDPLASDGVDIRWLGNWVERSQRGMPKKVKR